MEHTSHNTDIDVFRWVAAGDEAAFRELFHHWNRQLFPFIVSLVKNDTDAREIIQEIFLKCWLQKESLASIDNPGGWLRTVAANAAYDHLRKEARYELKLQQLHVNAGSSSQVLAEELDAKDTMKLINLAVQELPLRRRQVFQLSKIEGLSRKEIAEQLNISENTVRNQLADAVEFVQAYLARHQQVWIPVSVLLVTFS